jgi:hypothetical protein
LNGKEKETPIFIPRQQMAETATDRNQAITKNLSLFRQFLGKRDLLLSIADGDASFDDLLLSRKLHADNFL